MKPTSFAGLSLDHPRLMGILNVTPDSFSDGGLHATREAAIAHGLRLLEEGADILDIGGESTRPGAEPVTIDEELRRTLPVILALAKEKALISIDTRHARVMAEALDAGATIVNDVTALTGDAGSIDIIRKRGAPVILMHMQGEPRTMQQNPFYQDVIGDIMIFFRERLAACKEAGIKAEQICLDPGIGFGKDLSHNLTLLKRMSEFHELRAPLLLGTSRKSFIARLSAGEAVQERIGGSIASLLAGLEAGVQIFRVHDVRASRQAIKVWQAIKLDGTKPAD